MKPTKQNAVPDIPEMSKGPIHKTMLGAFWIKVNHPVKHGKKIGSVRKNESVYNQRKRQLPVQQSLRPMSGSASTTVKRVNYQSTSPETDVWQRLTAEVWSPMKRTTKLKSKQIASRALCSTWRADPRRSQKKMRDQQRTRTRLGDCTTASDCAELVTHKSAS